MKEEGVSEKSSGSEEKAQGEGKSKTFLIVVGVLFILIIAAGGYIVWSRMSADDAGAGNGGGLASSLGYVSKDEYDTLDQKLTVCENSLSVKPECEDDAGDLSMVKSEIEAGPYMISMEYPAKYYNIPVLLVPESVLDFYVKLGVDYPYEDTEYGEEIIAIRDKTFSDAGSTLPEDYQEIEIGGESYMIKMYKTGDAGPGGKSFITYYEVMLEDDLYVIVRAVDRMQNEECRIEGTEGTLPLCDDELDVVYEYMTSEEDLEEALAVLESITYELK